MKIILLIIIALCIILAVMLFFRHQRSLRRRAHLMREAIRNHDWSFRLNTRGLTSGERALQETLNDLGEIIHQQVNQSEVESWQRLTRVLTHEIISATATRLTTFVESYRKLAQLQQPKPEDVHLDDFFAEVRRLYPQLTWEIEGAKGIVVHTDPILLQQVVMNLVKNAMEAGASRIKVDSHPDLFISNNGSPIPASDRDSIFIPFFTTKHEGTGIGLALSRQILMRQGGDLELMEQPETGYTVTFKLTLS